MLVHFIAFSVSYHCSIKTSCVGVSSCSIDYDLMVYFFSIKDGVEPSPENSVSIRVRTVNPGEATLRLQVTVSSQSRHQVVRNGLLTDEIRIEVCK